jgi:hypothetical protein
MTWTKISRGSNLTFSENNNVCKSSIIYDRNVQKQTFLSCIYTVKNTIDIGNITGLLGSFLSYEEN